MSQRYVRISTFPENLYLDCSPVLISAGALLKDNKTGKVLAQLKFKNLSDNIINAVKVSVIAYDISGIELTGVEEYQYLDISIKPAESFGDDKAIILPDINTRNCVIVIKEVVFATIAPWRNNGSITCEPIPEQVPLQNVFNSSGLLEQYKRDTTDYSKYKPAKYLDLWLCSCGTANKRNSQKCSYCNIGLSQLLEATNLERITANYQLYQKQKDKENRERLEAKIRTRKITTVITTSVLLLLIAIVVFTKIVIPNMKYNAADKLLEQEQYEDAIVAFEALGEFRNSKDRAQEAIHLKQTNRINAIKDAATADMREVILNLIKELSIDVSSDIVIESELLDSLTVTYQKEELEKDQYIIDALYCVNIGSNNLMIQTRFMGNLYENQFTNDICEVYLSGIGGDTRKTLYLSDEEKAKYLPDHVTKLIFDNLRSKTEYERFAIDSTTYTISTCEQSGNDYHMKGVLVLYPKNGSLEVIKFFTVDLTMKMDGSLYSGKVNIDE